MQFEFLDKYSHMRSLSSYKSVLDTDLYDKWSKLVVSDSERLMTEKPDWESDMILYGKIAEAKFAWISKLENIDIDSVMLGADPAKEIDLYDSCLRKHEICLRNRYVDALIYEKRDLHNGYIACDRHYVEIKTNVSLYFVSKNPILFDQIIKWAYDQIHKIENHATERFSRYVLFCAALTFFKMPENPPKYVSKDWAKTYISRLGMPNKTRNLVNDIFDVEIDDLFVYDRKLKKIVYINENSCLFNKISDYYDKQHVLEPMTISAADIYSYSPDIFKEEFMCHIEYDSLVKQKNDYLTKLEDIINTKNDIENEIKSIDERMKCIKGDMRVCI